MASAPVIDRVPLGSKQQPESLQRRRASFRGMSPEFMSRVLRDLEDGDLEDWVDMVSFANRTDPHYASLRESRALSISGAEVVVTPGRGEPGTEQLAEDAAEAFRMELERYEPLPDLVCGLTMGEDVGWAGAENQWARTGGWWRNSPKLIQGRDIGFEDDLAVKVRTWLDGRAEEWFSVADENPARFMLHIPTKHDTPNVSGDFNRIAWAWLWKRWLQVWMVDAMERFGNPLMYVNVAENATPDVRENAFNGLRNLSAEQVAMFEGETAPAILEMAELPGRSWTEAIDFLNTEMTKGYLGSTLNVEIGEAGGNRAAAESQAKQTILPRLKTIAMRVATTLERDWAQHFLRFNLDKFGGKIPPTPQLEFKIVQDEPPVVSELMVMAKSVTIDELRVSGGLPALGPDKGGNAVATLPEEPTAPPTPEPQMARATEQEGEQRLPLAPTPSTLTSPPPSTPRKRRPSAWAGAKKSSATPSALAMRIGAALRSK